MIDDILIHPALAGMRAVPQWLVYSLIPSKTRPGKSDKIPLHHLTGSPTGVNDPRSWTDVYTAAAAACQKGEGYGVGFCFTPECGFWFLDLDSCAVEGAWSALAQQMVQVLPGAAVEISSSGKGLHLFGRGTVPAHSSRNAEHHSELYTADRFVALSGTALQGDCNTDCTAGISWVAQTYFPPRVNSPAIALHDGPRPEWRGPTDDGDLIRRALQSVSARSTFGGGVSFRDLWECNIDALARAFPSESQQDYDGSRADASLCQMLAFWTGADPERMDRLMRESGLARDKYDRDDYLPRTISLACGMQRDVLQDKPTAVDQALAAATPLAGALTTLVPGMVEVEGNTFLGPAEQIKLFAGCTYIVDAHRALVPGGYLLKPDQFRAKFGGYAFGMDARNEKVSRNAWEAFTESQVLRRPIADGTCFRPDLPFGTIVADAGRRRANLYWPIEVASEPGDVTPFLNHLAKLFPDVRDRRIALAYMAFCVQYPGYKSQWALLIQGVEGNGKTYLSRCVAEAVGRRYTYWPKAKKIAAQFNSWLYGHLFFAVEDIHTGADTDILDEIKPMITGGDGLEIEAKGVDQTTREICGNFMFNSNHKNSIKKTRNDRRFAMLFCAQQSVEDLARDGMDGGYMPGLYDWSKSGGYARVTHYLKTYDIPDEFNPATKCQRAPVTTSTDAAIEQSLGSAEQEIVEAIDAGEQGFMGGWVSSYYLDLLLDRIGKTRSVPLNRRRDMMRALGYEWHPALPGGRVNNVVLPDAHRPRLYVKRGHPALALTNPAEIAKAYTAAQS